MHMKRKLGLYRKSKQFLLSGKCICLTIPFVDSVYKFSEIYLSYSLNFTTNK